MGMGYILALAAYSLYVARGHLRQVWEQDTRACIASAGR